MLSFEPWTAGWEVQKLPLSYAETEKYITFVSLLWVELLNVLTDVMPK